MVIKSTLLGGTDMSTPSDRLKPTDWNDTFDAVAGKLRKIHEVYTSTGFDSTTITANPDEQSHELTAITAANLTNKKYVKIKITGINASVNSDGTNASVFYKIQAKETGGAYGDTLAETRILYHGNLGNDEKAFTFEYIHTLTAGEIANGCQFKVFSKSAYSAGGTASFTNIQTVVEIIGE